MARAIVRASTFNDPMVYIVGGGGSPRLCAVVHSNISQVELWDCFLGGIFRIHNETFNAVE